MIQSTQVGLQKKSWNILEESVAWIKTHEESEEGSSTHTQLEAIVDVLRLLRMPPVKVVHYSPALFKPQYMLQLKSQQELCSVWGYILDAVIYSHSEPHHNNLHSISNKRFPTVMAARCGDEQASVTSPDSSGGYEGMSRHHGRQREHKELWIITAAVNRLH